MFKKFFLLLLLISFHAFAQDLTHFSQNKTSFSGSISTTGNYYNAVGMEARRVPFSGVITGSFNLNLKGFNMPFSFSYSDQNKDFRQPFNQFGLSPKYKWATLHLGYRNINFSKYVLGGHTVFGAGVELNPGKFRFGFVYGRLKRATNQAVNIYKPVNDTLMDFSRKMMSLKIGFGTRKSFIDLNFLRAYDDSTSVDDEFKQKNIFPAANLVAGIHTRVQIIKNLSFETEGAVSIYTENQNSIIKFFDIPESLNKIIPVNASTSGKFAVEAKMEYQSKKNYKIGLNYRRIDPDYRSMGTYFMNNDVENLTLKTSFSALKNKMQLSGSIGLERNNLQSLRNATTHKTIGSVNVNYNPTPKFGITAMYSNYSVNQQAGRVQIADSVKLYQSNGTLMLSPHYSFMSKNKKYQHFVSWVFTRMQLSDKNPDSPYNNSFTTLNNILSYNISLVKSGLSFIASVNQNHVAMQWGDSDNTGATLGVNKRLKKQKLSVGLRMTYMRSKNAQRTMNTFTPVLTAQMRIGKHHSLRMRANMIVGDNTALSGMTTEQFGMLSYVYNF